MSPRNQVTLTVVAVVVMIAGSWIAGYVLALRSDSYHFAENRILSSPLIRESVGDPVSVSLEPFGYVIRLQGSSGEAEFDLKVKGRLGAKRVSIRLKKELGQWEAVAAKLEGKSIPL